jgi:hypothetical protein
VSDPKRANSLAGDPEIAAVLDRGNRSNSNAWLEVELANACVVRLKGLIDVSSSQAAIAAAGELDRSSHQGSD